MASFFLIGYYSRKCGFELPEVVLSNLRHSLHTEAGSHRHHPQAGVFLFGRFKACSKAEKKILAFLSAVTNSGLRPALWLDRLVKVLESLGIFSGWLFQGIQG
jgi:hypothetical protein